MFLEFLEVNVLWFWLDFSYCSCLILRIFVWMKWMWSPDFWVSYNLNFKLLLLLKIWWSWWVCCHLGMFINHQSCFCWLMMLSCMSSSESSYGTIWVWPSVNKWGWLVTYNAILQNLIWRPPYYVIRLIELYAQEFQATFSESMWRAMLCWLIICFFVYLLD